MRWDSFSPGPYAISYVKNDAQAFMAVPALHQRSEVGQTRLKTPMLSIESLYMHFYWKLLISVIPDG